MIIGYFALIFAAVCGLISLIGAAREEKPSRPAKDYRRVYEAVSPKEF